MSAAKKIEPSLMTYSFRQVALMTGYHLKSVERHARQGTLKAFKNPQGHWRVTHSEYLRYSGLDLANETV